MIRRFPFTKLGSRDFGWLNAHYHFSFANYYDPDKSGFPPLLVWNDDEIQPMTGFPMHSHKDMEIITYIRAGAITHEDNLGNKGVTRAGEIQIMSAGNGITHSEYNFEDSITILFQIWIQPYQMNLTPRWEKMKIDENQNERLVPIASGEEKFAQSAMLKIHQDATLYILKGQQNSDLIYELNGGRFIYLVVSEGEMQINGETILKRDGVFIQNEAGIEMKLSEKSEAVILDSAQI